MNKSLLLKRFIVNSKGTFGALFDGDRVICLTAERPYLDNKTAISSIPDGVRLCKRFSSEKHPNTFEITGVEGRTAILFHSGNDPLVDSNGCVLLGFEFEMEGDQWSVLSSKAAFQSFMDYLKDEQSFQLAIKTV